MTIRPIQDGDYENILCKWWEDWGWTAPLKDFLPGTGFIVYDEETPVCAAFFYSSNSKVCWIEWLISNKQYRKKPNRSESILFLLTFLCELSKEHGFKYCVTMSNSKQLIQTYESLGFVSDKGNSQTLILCQHLPQ